jgi:hypothetical protein
MFLLFLCTVVAEVSLIVREREREREEEKI